MSNPRFFYFYDTTGEHRRPMVTVCRVRDEHGDYGYGWSICSAKDNPCKHIGRAIAHGRAISALCHKTWKLAREGELSTSWLPYGTICRTEALMVLKNVEVMPQQTHARLSTFSVAQFFSHLPASMQPR